MDYFPLGWRLDAAISKITFREVIVKRTPLIIVGVSAWIAVLTAGVAVSAQVKYSIKVPGGLAFAEFRGYEDWSVIAISQRR
jgi:hypothetical protein